MAYPTPQHSRPTRPAAHADAKAMPRVLTVSRPGRCAAAAGAGVFDQVDETDPFLSIDVFRRQGACIPPHPHAGCAVATYLFPDATTAMRCRHAHGGDDVVRPGDLLWLDTNCGTVHEELPEHASAVARGVRMIVNRAGRHAHGAPVQTVVRADAMPRWREGALDMTLICGEWDERRVVRDEDEQGEQRERTTLLQLDWRKDDLRTLAIPCDGRRWIAMMVCGDAALASHALRAEGGAAQALLLPPGEWQLAGRAGARLMLAGGEPLGEPVVYRGNFAARDESELVALTRRYQQGAMGTLTCPGE
ncbi:pirin-like C-terminal cupin domain-containing protein [Pandoraea pulmonicola]|uniref:Pirin n=1 Tax=Pandoraea pulmonicola TaxID=93221 RepID=A0AAJ4ZDX6_PANPU|nr:pirin-like C-terminal cupin domain-containing protein [Pandoraea pulmonicola]AJC20112.1 hypothetical protein RO07_05805 [Pandoraea pulmonicola]SUA91602.1 Pirin [Pandoraea pulmonicola]